MTLAQPVQPIPETELKPRIKVIGVGGAGGNAINNMIRSKLEGVEFYVCNTDAQHVEQSLTDPDKRIQLGLSVTQGLGAGSRPEVGRAAAEESMDEILRQIDGANMVFITAGMGGGTGTGAAPVLAQAAREQGILTVGVVTKPFLFEGELRMRSARSGIEELEKYVDTLIVIPNQNLFRVANEDTTFADAFKMADDVLYSGVRGVTDLMMMPGLINLDFADIRAVMTEMGKAMMGTGEAEGEGRAIAASEDAISNPLLDDVSMRGAQGVLINITGGMDMTLFEVDEAANRIREEIDPELSKNTNIIFGSTFDEKLNGKIRVSVVATGIDKNATLRKAAEKQYAASAQQAAPAGQRPAVVTAPRRRESAPSPVESAQRAQAAEPAVASQAQSYDAPQSHDPQASVRNVNSYEGTASARTELSQMPTSPIAEEIISSDSSSQEGRQDFSAQQAQRNNLQSASTEMVMEAAAQLQQEPQAAGYADSAEDSEVYPFERNEQEYSSQVPYDFSNELKQHSISYQPERDAPAAQGQQYSEGKNKTDQRFEDDRFASPQSSLSADGPASNYLKKKKKKEKKKRGLIGRFVDSVRGRSDDDYTEGSSYEASPTPSGGYLADPPSGWDKGQNQDRSLDPMSGYSGISTGSSNASSAQASGQSEYYDRASQQSEQNFNSAQEDRYESDSRFTAQGDERFAPSSEQQSGGYSGSLANEPTAYQEEEIETGGERAPVHENLRLYSNPNEKQASSAAYQSDVQDVPAFVRRKQKS